MSTYSPEQWASRQQYTARLTDICRDEGIEIEWMSELWIARLEKAGRVKYIVSNSLPINDGGAKSVARDKGATFEVLHRQGIPTVAHYPIRMPLEVTDDAIDQLAQGCLELSQLPMVIKPLTESAGKDVYKITSLPELTSTLCQLSARYTMAAVSPFEDISTEYRVIMLDGQAKYMFAKIRPVDAHGQLLEWRHNLHHGSVAEPVNDPPLGRRLTELAARVMREIGLTYASVDLVSTSGGLKVLEVNSSGFISPRAASEPVIRGCYRDVLRLAFSRT